MNILKILLGKVFGPQILIREYIPSWWNFGDLCVQEEIGKSKDQEDDCVECDWEGNSDTDFAVHKVPSHCDDVLCMSNFVKCEECAYEVNTENCLEVHEDLLHEDGREKVILGD